MLSNFVRVDLVGATIAEKSIDNYRFLRKQGVSIRKTIDVIIATFCIENKVLLLHADKYFLPLERYCGLKSA